MMDTENVEGTMAHWSQKESEKRVAEKRARILAERADLFRLFRANGWEINVLSSLNDRDYTLAADDLPFNDCHFLLKMPSAYPVRIRTFGQLLRLSKGMS